MAAILAVAADPADRERHTRCGKEEHLRKPAAEDEPPKIDKLPDHLREASFAMDIAPLTTGGFSMVESNPSAVSGFFAPKWNAFTGLQMHKGFTGQHSVPVSAIGALGTGAAAAALTRNFAPPGGIKLPSVNSEDDDAPKQAYYSLGQ